MSMRYTSANGKTLSWLGVQEDAPTREGVVLKNELGMGMSEPFLEPKV